MPGIGSFPFFFCDLQYGRLGVPCPAVLRALRLTKKKIRWIDVKPHIHPQLLVANLNAAVPCLRLTEEGARLLSADFRSSLELTAAGAHGDETLSNYYMGGSGSKMVKGSYEPVAFGGEIEVSPPGIDGNNYDDNEDYANTPAPSQSRLATHKHAGSVFVTKISPC